MNCWPQACLSDWASVPWDVALATIAVGVISAAIPALLLAGAVWLLSVAISSRRDVR